MDGGCIRTDQGGELASSFAFGDLILKEFHYTLEPTGVGSPSQNGAVEIYNDKLGIRTCSLLYGSGLPAKYWSAALIHVVTFTIAWFILLRYALRSNPTTT